MDNTKTEWPEKPTCHDDDYQAQRFAPQEWRAPLGHHHGGCYDYEYRQCSYCGCIHPEDLVKALEAGAAIDVADWKYGWPHKFYISGLPNSIAGQSVETGSHTIDGVTTPIMGAAPPTVTAKWYNVHIMDQGFSEENLAKLLKLLHERSGVEFTLKEGGLHYKGTRPRY